MKGPFPGMDPYLEKHWGDVHHSLIANMRRELNDALPNDLVARVEERVFIESPFGKERHVIPDVRVVEHAPIGAAPTAVAEAVALAEPLELHIDEEPVTEGYLEIRDAGSGDRVITVIEVLSRGNKHPGEGQRLYRQKQGECREGGVSLVEIDLLRAGQRVFVVPVEMVPPPWRTTYQVCVWRAWQPARALIYRAPLRDRLPVIGIPLRETDPLARLDLQTLLDQCYRDGRYDSLDYHAEPDPPLETADREWADQLLRDQGRR